MITTEKTGKTVKKRYLILFIALYTATLSGASLEKIELKKGLKPEDYDFHLKPFGRTTWLVSCFTKELQPALNWRQSVSLPLSLD